MTEEFAYLPEEYSRPAAEWTPPVRERVYSVETTPRESAPEEHSQSKGLRQQLKAYAMSAVAAVTVVSALTSAPAKWDYEAIDRDLSDFHFAYCAQSSQELEVYLENEMWYQFFGKLGDHEARYYGLYGKSDDGPTREFRDALTVSGELHTHSGVLDLPAYGYQLQLWDGPAPEEDLWNVGNVVVLDRPNQVVVAYRENGEEHFGIVEDVSEVELMGEQLFFCPFDITTRPDGQQEAAVRVFGNGVDIVGIFDQNLSPGEDNYVVVHATNEHSNNACGNDLAYIIRIARDGAGSS